MYIERLDRTWPLCRVAAASNTRCRMAMQHHGMRQSTSGHTRGERPMRAMTSEVDMAQADRKATDSPCAENSNAAQQR